MRISKQLLAGSVIVSLMLVSARAQEAALATDRVENLRPPSAGICAHQPVLDEALIGNGMPIGPGTAVFAVSHAGTFDVTLVGGGGGGGAGRAGKPFGGGGSGGHSEFKPIFQRLKLERDYYLIQIGAGGVGGTGSWNWGEPSAARNSQGSPGGDTHIWRCSSGASLALVRGGAGGAGEVLGVKDGVPGEDFANLGDDMIAASSPAGVAARGEAIGQGGAGGPGANFNSGAAGGSGQDGKGYGAGGGGQGKTDLQIDGDDPRRAHGGKGADGVARFIRVG